MSTRRRNPLIQQQKTSLGPRNVRSQKSTSGCCSSFTWHNFWQICTLVLVLIALVVVILSVAFSANQDSLQRYCVEGDPTKVVGAVGELGGQLFGVIQLDSSDNVIKYDFRYYSPPLSSVQALHIRGPLIVGSQVAPIKVALCGSPSTVVCDITSVPGQIVGTLQQISPAGSDIHTVIADIRKEPWLYYLEVLTSGKPASPGAMRAPMNSICGTP